MAAQWSMATSMRARPPVGNFWAIAFKSSAGPSFDNYLASRSKSGL